jgi:UDP-N-acetylmuramoyl-tripeptide--D-alanyl-D-alanine ligase
MGEQQIPVALTVIFLAVWARPYGLDGWRALHLLQLEEYQTARYSRWLGENARQTFDRWLLGSSVFVLAAALLGPWQIGSSVSVVASAVGIWQTLRRANPPAKKPLVLTSRARRLLAGWLLCVLVAGGLVAWGMLSTVGGPSAPIATVAAAALVLSLAAWPLMAFANLLLFPVEASYRQFYLRDARQRLHRYRPVVVGVAGSYGKTSTKTILAQILAARFPTLATPRSFNTPMGLCRVIREQLLPEHRFFIAELGAYQRGEIRQLCELVGPTIGVLTAVGPEHLERFGSLEEVIRAEFEIVEALPRDGVAIFNGDDETCLALATRATCRRIVVGGPPGPDRELWATDVSTSADGIRFTVCHRDGRRLAVSTCLLGRHNVYNILAASAAALVGGLPFEDLPGAIGALAPVEHRLQLIPNDNGVIVIDDTYNSNPRGAAAALETLDHFQGGHRYLVTPGMVELAELQDAAHRDFGRQAAAVCSAVILIGPRRTRAIAAGLSEAGYADDHVIVAKTLDEATERLRQMLRPGDAVLFENDLPDNYVE